MKKMRHVQVGAQLFIALFQQIFRLSKGFCSGEWAIPEIDCTPPKEDTPFFA